MLVQRFGLLTNPDPESVALVATLLDEAKVGSKAYDKGGDVRRGALYALGTAAGTATRTKEGAWAAPYVERVRTELRAAKEPNDRAAALVALGNARNASDVFLIESYAHDGERTIRAAAARALGHTSTPEGRGTLVSLIVDSGADVAGTAIDALGANPTTPVELQAIASEVEAGKVTGNVAPALTELLAKQLEASPDAARALRAMLPQTTNPHLRARIAQILEYAASHS